MHTLVRNREGILERLHTACVGGRRIDGILVFGIERRVGREWIAFASVGLGLLCALLSLTCATLRSQQGGRRNGRRTGSQKSAPRPPIFFRSFVHACRLLRVYP